MMRALLAAVPFMVLSMAAKPSFAEEVDFDAIANRPCPIYAEHLIRLRSQESYNPESHSEALEAMAITSYLRGAFLAFSPSGSYFEFENQFIQTCLGNAAFPPTQVVAFFMLRGN